ncbi:hypothetical protein ACFPRL_23780 [Pseudoclavibacter helvolus]
MELWPLRPRKRVQAEAKQPRRGGSRRPAARMHDGSEIRGQNDIQSRLGSKRRGRWVADRDRA